MLYYSEDTQSEVIEAFISTAKYLENLSNIDNSFFDSIVKHVYPSVFHLNKVNV